MDDSDHIALSINTQNNAFNINNIYFFKLVSQICQALAIMVVVYVVITLVNFAISVNGMFLILPFLFRDITSKLNVKQKAPYQYT